MRREIVLDTETTGLDPVSGHRIVEIGCLELIGGARTGKFFHSYLNPERDVPEEAYRVHGLGNEFLRDKPIFSEIVEDLVAFLADSPLVIHNAAFDMRFVNAELERVGFGTIPSARALDTLAVARKKFPGAPASLDALCKRFGVDLSGRDKHGALLDAELLAEVYVELIGGRQVALMLEAESSEAVTVSTKKTERAMLAPRNFSPSQDELAAHAAMLGKIKKPVWAA